jgi:hypothetical protein
MDQKVAFEALEPNIVEACTNHQLVHWQDRNYRPCVSIGTDYVVKFGGSDDPWPELQSQSCIFDYARHSPHPDAPRIPQVVHYFRDNRTKYLVMEFITLTATPLDFIDHSTGSRMALERPTSQPCDWSLRRLPSAINSLGITRHLWFSQASRL